MAFTDPQTITIDSTAYAMARIYTGTSQGRFATSDGNTRIELDPKVGSRRVSILRLYQNKLIADPLVGTVNVRVGDMWSLTLNRPLDGYSDTEALNQFLGLSAWLTTSANANLKKLIAGEN